MKHIFVINPAAGQGKALDFIKPKIEWICKKFNLDYEIYVTEKKGDGIEFVDNMSEPVKKSVFTPAAVTALSMM